MDAPIFPGMAAKPQTLKSPHFREAAVDGAPADAAALQKVVTETARAASVLGVEMADIAGTIADTRQLAETQGAHFAEVGAGVAAMIAGNTEIRDEARAAAESSRLTRDNIESALGVAVATIESGLDTVGGSLGGAVDAANEIARIALQTRMVALNASVQAAHAGSEGNAFGVVAAAVRDLAEKIQASSKTIAATLAALTGTVQELANRERAQDGGPRGSGLRSAVDASLARFREEFSGVERRIDNVAQHAERNLEACTKVDESVRSMAAKVTDFEKTLTGAALKSDRLLGMSERLMELTADSGAETDDTPFIETAIAAAAEMRRLLTGAVAGGEIRLDDLFDDRYEPVPNTDPQQFTTKFVALTDRLFTPVQESVLAWSDRVAFCAAVDRNGYLPTHNRVFSKPQSADAVWNAANCRNRRLFQDRTGAAAGRNTRPFVVQSYRRDMGGGVFAILKEVDAPIAIEGRHWGNVRLAYRIEAGRRR
ncbi:MAG: hypothetical protein KGL92_05510 [Gammaproteobacteria bacterium]|nr:hypothetical protein [Gammaproteobacteria bacterium]